MSHAEHLLRALDMFRCTTCGMPVGKESRGSSVCRSCNEKDVATL